MWRAIAWALAILAAVALCPAAALGDADPASDVLLATNVFYPYSPAVSSRLQAALNAEVAAAHRARFPIKVALIANSTDLGAIPELFDKPRQYAPFLDQEISFAVKAPVLVVMPNGEGAAGLSRAAQAAAASLPRPSGTGSNALAEAAISAIPKLATAAGDPLGGVTTPAPTSAGGGGATVLLAVVIAVCATLAAGILAVRRRRAQPAAARRR